MIFIDTGALVAYFNESDRFHTDAVKGFARLERATDRAMTTPLCVAETLGLLAALTGDHGRVAKIGMNILAWGGLDFVRPTLAEERRALSLMESYAERRVGYIDCVSFVVMDARGLDTAFTFDHEHFVKVRGLRPWVPIARVTSRS